MAACASEAFVTLRDGRRGGLTVPVEPYRLVLDLEARGVTLTREGEALMVGPARRVTDRDRELLIRWKFHILALISYEAPAEIQ